MVDNHIVWTDEDGVVHIRNSERGTLDKCPQRWWWSWREGLRPKETPKALWFGSAIHEALAHYYKPHKRRAPLGSTLDVFQNYADMEAEYVRVNVGGLDEDEWVSARDLGVQMLTGYHQHYGGDKHWDVIATEQSFDIAVPWLTKKALAAMPVERRLMAELLRDVADFETEFFILNGTFDGVYYDLKDKKFKLMEHKTAASISWGHLLMDNQAGTYHTVAQSVGRKQGWLPEGKNISEITYNFLRKGMPDERPRDAKGYCTNLPKKEHYFAALEEAGVEPPALKKDQTLTNLAAVAERAGITVLGDRSKSQPPPLYLRHPVKRTNAMRKSQLERVKVEVTKMALYTAGVLEVTKSANRDTCPMCPYRDMCELHESGGGWVEFRDALFRAEDPYAVHKKSA